MFDKIRPLGDRVLVKKLEEQEEKTAGGIIIPDAAKEKAQVGKVVAVGKGRRAEDGTLVPMDIKIGDTVFYAKYAGVDVGKEHLLLRGRELIKPLC